MADTQPKRKDNDGDPPLFIAARMNNYLAVDLMIRYSQTVPNPFSDDTRSGQNILNWKNKREETPLYIAVHCGYLEIVDLLMCRGACPVEKWCKFSAYITVCYIINSCETTTFKAILRVMKILTLKYSSTDTSFVRDIRVQY